MKRTITCEEISKNLPMRATPINPKSMAYGKVVRFDSCRNEEGKDWQLVGKTEDGTIRIIELQKETVYETIG